MFENKSVADELMEVMTGNLESVAENDYNSFDNKKNAAIQSLIKAAEAFDYIGKKQVAKAAQLISEKVDEYIPTHEGPGEFEREQLEEGMIDIPEISGETSELEEEFLDKILGEDEKSDTKEIIESNEADDINLIDEIFEDVE